MEIISSYINGNTQVDILSDGTKSRTINGDSAAVIHPESLDVKITNYCDAGCNFCHERSTISGKHADLDKLSEILSSLPSGVEIAIGGGNPLAHPDLLPFLVRCKNQGLICNLTVNQKHIFTFRKELINLIQDKLIYGLGISYLSIKYLNDIAPLINITDNIVFHVIMGINKLSDIETLNSYCLSFNKKCKILVLGYKHYGFGINYYIKNKNIEDNKYQWYTGLADNFGDKNLILSFDNLAISQLNLKRYFTEDAWRQFYMGDDFVYTMYVDAVEQTYAPSSTSPSRYSFNNYSLLEFFQTHKKSA